MAGERLAEIARRASIVRLSPAAGRATIAQDIFIADLNPSCIGHRIIPEVAVCRCARIAGRRLVAKTTVGK
jgi:hypothetical protein